MMRRKGYAINLTIPLPYSWPALLPFWLACVWSFSAELPFIGPARRDARTAASQDVGSYWLIIAADVVAAAGAFSAAAIWPTASMANQAPVYVAGIICIVAGGLLRRHCFAMLGQRFTFVVKAAVNQTVVERGAYKYVRHPSYTAGLLLYGGVGMALANWISVAFSIVPLAMAYAYRIAVEERALTQTIGLPYSDYMKRTHRLIPFVL